MSNDTQALLDRGQRALAAAQWAQSAQCFGLAVERQSDNAAAWHNLGLSLFALGKTQDAISACQRALRLNPSMLPTYVVLGKASKSLGDAAKAHACFSHVLKMDSTHAQARLALADLSLNVFGQPLQAVEWVKPLLDNPEYAEDAELTTLMAGLYDRDTSAEEHNSRIIRFSQKSLQLDPASFDFLPDGHSVGPTQWPLPNQASWKPISGRQRPRVGLLSPLFCASPVYFLTIAGWRRVARGSDVVIFNRGNKQDWATQNLKDLAHEWHDVQEISAEQLAARIYGAQLDVLYDLGGWMDPIGLKALSVKPAPQMFKWVGGQSVTTGLKCFDGWIGDDWQSPMRLQHLFTEPLVNIAQGYAVYTPPDYMPQIPANKRDVPVIFSNPAKLSRSFLKFLKSVPGKKCFVHQQFKYPQSRVQTLQYLSESEVEFVVPSSHKEALEVLSQHRVMIDTFPYSSGLTAQEAMALGVKVQARVGTLFCERHCARLSPT